MLKEALEELDSGNGAVLNALSAVVAVLKRDLPILETLQSVVGQSDTENVTAKVL